MSENNKETNEEYKARQRKFFEELIEKGIDKYCFRYDWDNGRYGYLIFNTFDKLEDEGDYIVIVGKCIDFMSNKSFYEKDSFSPVLNNNYLKWSIVERGKADKLLIMTKLENKQNDN